MLEHLDALIADAENRNDWALAEQLLLIAIELTRKADGDDSDALKERTYRLARILERSGHKQAADDLKGDIGTPVPAAPPPAPVAASRAPIERRRLESAETQAAPVATAGAAPSADSENTRCQVHFVTSRHVTGRTDPYAWFDGTLNESTQPLTYGIAEVSVPLAQYRKVGELRTPSLLQRALGTHSDELYLLKAVRALASREAFLASLRRQIRDSRDGGKEALIFVHGFYVQFWEAMVRAAQLGVDLEIDGAVAAFSWPSQGSVLGYNADRDQIKVKANIAALQQLIADVTADPEVRRVIIVAHSLGCEFLLSALQGLQTGWQSAGAAKPRPDVIREVIFAAPDVAAERFDAIIPALAPLGARVTVYCSRKDTALVWGQRLFSKLERAGLHAEQIADSRVSFLDSIETTEVCADVLGHTDYASSAIDDLRARVWLSLMPKQRGTLIAQKTKQGAEYWSYRPDMKAGAGGDAFRQAVVWARRHRGIEPALKAIQQALAAWKDNPDERGNFDRHLAIAAALKTMSA